MRRNVDGTLEFLEECKLPTKWSSYNVYYSRPTCSALKMYILDKN